MSLPIIAVDIDGVLTNLTSPFLDLFNKHHNTSFKYQDVTTYEFEDSIGLPKELVAEFWRTHIDSDFYLNLAFDEMGLSVLSDWQKCARIWVITARSLAFASSTEQCFINHGFKPDALIHSDNKIEFADVVDVMIEDKLSTANAFVSRGVPTILFDAPYNQLDEEPFGMHRVHGWNEVDDVFEELLTDIGLNRVL